MENVYHNIDIEFSVSEHLKMNLIQHIGVPKREETLSKIKLIFVLFMRIRIYVKGEVEVLKIDPICWYIDL